MAFLANQNNASSIYNTVGLVVDICLIHTLLCPLILEKCEADEEKP